MFDQIPMTTPRWSLLFVSINVVLTAAMIVLVMVL